MNCKIYYLRILKITCYEKVSFSRYFKFLFTGLFLFFSCQAGCNRSFRNGRQLCCCPGPH